jgi:hypothetical protein
MATRAPGAQIIWPMLPNIVIIHLMQHNSLQMEEWGHFVVKG